jgi:hypothetical protein
MIRILIAILACLMMAAPAFSAEPVALGAYLSMTGNVAAYGGMGWDGISIARKMEP